jgi:hypothetical protein
LIFFLPERQISFNHLNLKTIYSFPAFDRVDGFTGRKMTECQLLGEMLRPGLGHDPTQKQKYSFNFKYLKSIQFLIPFLKTSPALKE